MEHYYVVCGNEFGVDLSSKKNFTELNHAKKFFDKVKYDDFGSFLVYVDNIGTEKVIEVFVNE